MSDTPQNQNLEDNLPMVNYIMLHRIYDMLTLIAKGTEGADEVSKMVDYHEVRIKKNGRFNPSGTFPNGLKLNIIQT